ncbi:MAG: DsrE family protein [Gammaproteobacteria bacterium]|jgi:predicted peroxiredoxin
MAKKLLIILANSDPENPEEFSAPLFQAMVAAAMSHKVEVIFTGLSGVLAVVGHAEQVIFNIREHRTVYDVIKEAHQAGVVFKVCSPTLEMWGSELIAEVDETIGTAYIIEEAMSDDTVTFTY